jgi:tetratricopeptide (TPR) repeat protein
LSTISPVNQESARKRLARHLTGILVADETLHAVVQCGSIPQLCALTDKRVITLFELAGQTEPSQIEVPLSKINGARLRGSDLTLWRQRETALLFPDCYPLDAVRRVADLIGLPQAEQFRHQVPAEKQALLETFNQFVGRQEPILALGNGDVDAPGLLAVSDRRLLISSIQMSGKLGFRSCELGVFSAVKADPDCVRIFSKDDNFPVRLTGVDPEVVDAIAQAVGVLGIASTAEDRERARALSLRGVEEMEAGRINEARELFQDAGRLGCDAALFLLGALADEEGDTDTALTHWKHAAALGHECAARCISLHFLTSGHAQGAIDWLNRAWALGRREAMREIGAIYVTDGDLISAERSFSQGVTDGDPESAYQLMILHVQTPGRPPEMMEPDLESYVQLTLRDSLKDQPWAFIQDISALSDDQVAAYDAQANAWARPYSEVADTIKAAGGPWTLPRAVGDPEVVREALKVHVRWLELMAGRAKQHTEQALIARDRARQEASDAQAAFDRRGLVVSGSGNVGHWQGPTIELTGCRLLSDTDARQAATGVTVRMAPDEPLVFVIHGAARALDWSDVDGLVVDVLQDQARVTAPRAAAFGVFALGAKKRTSWCVLTVDSCHGRLVFEIPTEAHRLTAIFANGGKHTRSGSAAG